MPFVDLIIPNAGLFSFRCSISTPSSKSAESIVPFIPCIIFLHSCYISQEVFEREFVIQLYQSQRNSHWNQPILLQFSSQMCSYVNSISLPLICEGTAKRGDPSGMNGIRPWSPPETWSKLWFVGVSALNGLLSWAHLFNRKSCICPRAISLAFRTAALWPWN